MTTLRAVGRPVRRECVIQASSPSDICFFFRWASWSLPGKLLACREFLRILFK